MCKMNVNLFIICSAVLLRNREFKFCRFIKIILYTVIISILSILCYLVIGDESIGKKDIIKSFFPVLSNSFWFITCYLGLYLLYPIINKFIDGFKGVKNQIIIALLIYFVLFMYPNCFLVNSIVYLYKRDWKSKNKNNLFADSILGFIYNSFIFYTGVK